MKEMRFS